MQNKSEYSGIKISDIKDLVNASNKDITFFHSKKYELEASKTKAAFCITTKNLANKLPDTCKPIEVDNVLVSTAMITTMFYLMLLQMISILIPQILKILLTIIL